MDPLEDRRRPLVRLNFAWGIALDPFQADVSVGRPLPLAGQVEALDVPRPVGELAAAPGAADLVDGEAAEPAVALGLRLVEPLIGRRLVREVGVCRRV